MQTERQVPIWFFVGGTLLVYGIIILATGLAALAHPSAVQVALQKSHPNASWFFFHADIWWGGIMIVVGGLYCRAFHPWRKRPT
jgi:uncharacterized membrane protein YgdD (TMEM256/DUF423 family)